MRFHMYTVKYGGMMENGDPDPDSAATNRPLLSELVTTVAIDELPDQL